ncbi:MAG: hypothetical protein IK011_05745, partial [Bacteroidaceae bacterium]|nr:hypothetical protein [Bacteroidaceae bacterium]
HRPHRLMSEQCVPSTCSLPRSPQHLNVVSFLPSDYSFSSTGSINTTMSVRSYYYQRENPNFFRLFSIVFRWKFFLCAFTFFSKIYVISLRGKKELFIFALEKSIRKKEKQTV